MNQIVPLARPQPADDRNLRRELADANSDRDAATAALRSAKAAYERAERLRQDAAVAVDRLKAGLDAAQRAATKDRARAVAEAVRMGRAAPAYRRGSRYRPLQGRLGRI